MKNDTKDSFVVHISDLDDIPEEYLATFLVYEFRYAKYGEIPAVGGFEKTAWLKIQRRMDYDRKAWLDEKEKRSNAGKLGNEIRWGKRQSQTSQCDTETSQCDTETSQCDKNGRKNRCILSLSTVSESESESEFGECQSVSLSDVSVPEKKTDGQTACRPQFFSPDLTKALQQVKDCSPTKDSLSTLNDEIVIGGCDVDLTPSPRLVYVFCMDNHLPIHPERFWEYNNLRGWKTKDGLPIKHWQKAYFEMCKNAGGDEAFDPAWEFNSDNYDYFTGTYNERKK